MHRRKPGVSPSSRTWVIMFALTPLDVPQAQVLQMPRRQPEAKLRPWASRAGKSGAPEATCTTLPLRASVMLASSVASLTTIGSVNASLCSTKPWTLASALAVAIKPAGTQAMSLVPTKQLIMC